MAKTTKAKESSAETELNKVKNEKEQTTTENKEVSTPGEDLSVVTNNSSLDSDNITPVKFLTQFSKDVGDVDGDGDHDSNDKNIACCVASKLMIQRAGFGTVNGAKRIDCGVFNATMNIRPCPTTQKAYDMLIKNSQEGKPTLAGVNRKKKTVGNANPATSHFVVITDIEEHGKGRLKLRFFDPGTTHENLGTSDTNWLYYDEADGLYKGRTAYDAKLLYILTEVRPTLDKA